jgi:class 3 adenylate cyclase
VSTTRLRTTAILKTDITGSTPRFRATAEADLAPLLREHRALVERLAAAHEGHMVKPEGDGFWLAFPSVTAAALAAMSMQEALRLAQPNTGEDRLSMRIVITLGDVLHQDGALVGDAVVLATRIEALTPPDQIYLSAAAWLTMNHAEIRTSFVNGFALKGFTEPVAVYRIEQLHRTHVIANQYIVVTDLTAFTRLIETGATTVVEAVLDALHDVVAGVCHDFGGVDRFSVGDGYCLTFTDPGRAMAGVERLVTAWSAFASAKSIPCRINVAVHKGTLYAFRSYLHGRDLNVAFAIEGATQREPGPGVFVSGVVQRDLVGTRWETQLTLVRLPFLPAILKDVDIFGVEYTARADTEGGTA